MSKLSSLLHSLALLLITAHSSFSQSASGSGGEPKCTDCIPPAGALPLANLTKNVTEAIIEARCLAMCLHVQLQNDSVIIHEKDSYLYVKQSDLEADCILYRQVHNCARGCLSASRIGNESQCSKDCMSDCESNAYQGHNGICTGGCNTFQCNQGCSAYKTMRDGENSFLVPNKPSLPLEMLEDNSSATVGMYVVNVTNADWSKDPTLGSNQESRYFSPETQKDVELAQFFVTFVVQVVEQEQVDVVYMVEAGLLENLSLNFFSCEDVAVSYALVNKHGPSTFSEFAPIQTVKGVELSQPKGVSNLMVDWYYDTRQGFFGHFCMNLSWLNPTDLNSVKLYEIAYDTQNHKICGPTEEKIISPSPDQRSTDYTFICAADPESAFIGKCTYYLCMTTIPILDCAENVTSNFISLSVPSYQPQLNPKCARRLNQTDNRFVIDLTIELTSYLIGEQVVEGFNLLLVRIQYQSNGVFDEDILKSPYKKKMPASESVFTESFYGLEPRAETNIEYSVGVLPNWKGTIQPGTKAFYCSVSALSERPDIITHVTLNKLTIQDNFKFKVVVNWDKPGSFNGAFVKYEVAIAGTALAPDVNEVLSGTLTVEITSVNETQLDMVFPYHPSTFCYYLQVRSSNKYLASNWSEPLVLPVDSQCPDYPLSTPTCSEQQPVPNHMYECRAHDEEAEDLICTACYPDGEDGHYNCSCWASQQPEPEEMVYRTCQDALMQGENESGVYMLKPDHLSPFQAYCDMETDGGGWTVLQRRMDGSVDFYLNWTDYVHGFGNKGGEYWLGLSKIHRLANSSMPQELRIDLEDFSTNTQYAKYSSFYIGAQSTDYTLHVSGYSGTAGDSLTYHHGSKFSTKDNDNDMWSSNCAIQYQGAWWYNRCYHSNLNGMYLTGDVINYKGICWHTNYSKKYADMKVRSRD